MQDINWKFILNTIKSEKCVLLLGPELPIAPGNKPVHNSLCNFLDVKNNKSISSYYDRDGFFLFPDGMAKTFVFYEMKDFFAQNFENDILKKITQIPFHLIISLNPDNKISETLNNYKIPHEFQYYRKKQKPNEVDTPTKLAPLIYNLFGSISEEESLVLTHDDLFDFLHTSLGTYSLPVKLQKTLQDADNFIFLGFRFDRWYLQLLIRLLNPPDDKFKYIRYSLSQNINADIKSFYVEQFKINFIENNETAFIDTLHKKCEDEGLLRNFEHGQASLKDRLIASIENDEIENVLKMLKEQYADTDNEDILMMQTSRYNRLQRNTNKGVLDSKEAELELNRIKDALIDLIKIIDK